MNYIYTSIFFIINLILIAKPSYSRTLFVPKNYSTIQEALDKAENNDTVIVKKGVYKENIVMPNGVILSGELASETILKGDRKNPVIKASNNSIIENFTITRGGIGILSENTNTVIRNNIIRGNFKTGIQCVLSLPHIRNNIILNNKWSGIYCELVTYGTRTAIEHNIIADNENTGIMLSRESGVLVQNNVIYRNQQYGINVTENSRKSRLIYNNFYLNRRGYNNFAIVDVTNVSKDPKFPLLALTSFKFLESYKSPTNSSGKNGAPIGLIQKSEFKNFFQNSKKDSINNKLRPLKRH